MASVRSMNKNLLSVYDQYSYYTQYNVNYYVLGKYPTS